MPIVIMLITMFAVCFGSAIGSDVSGNSTECIAAVFASDCE